MTHRRRIDDQEQAPLSNPNFDDGARNFGWKEARVPEAGTYRGTSDLVQRDGESLVAMPGALGMRATKGKDITPDDQGDWGLAARWSPAWLDRVVGVTSKGRSRA